MPRVLTPNINFIPGSVRDVFDPRRSAAVWGMERLNETTSLAGYDGIELHDANLFAHTWELRHARQAKAQRIGRQIFSLHESWVNSTTRGGDTTQTALRRQRLGLQVASRIMFPTGPRSLQQLIGIEAKLGRELPYVVYPNEAGRLDVDQRKVHQLKQAGIQPTIDVMMAWKVDSPAGLVDQLHERGYDVVWDHFHGDRRGVAVDGRMRQDEYLPPLLAADLVRAVHIGLFRVDFRDIDPDRSAVSMTEGIALQRNGSLERLPLGDMFAELRHANWQGNVTIEASQVGMEDHLGRLPLTAITEAHHQMTDGVREQLPGIVWDAAVM